MSYDEYIESFDSHAMKLGMQVKHLPEDLRLYTWGEGHKLLFVVSGIHGEERAGPIFLHRLVQSGFTLPAEFRIKICPIVHPKAWSTKLRKPGGKNANRLWNDKAPTSIRALMTELQSCVPDVYLDMHEDDECKGPRDSHYVFRNVNSSWGHQLQRELNVSTRKGVWRKLDGQTSESFVFSLGCMNTSTIESNSHRDLGDRVKFHHDAFVTATEVWKKQNVAI